MKKGILFFLILVGCSKVDYYDDIKRDCDLNKAKNYYERLKGKSDVKLMRVIEAMADCRSEEMDRFLSEEYSRSPENIKIKIYDLLIKNKSRAFLGIATDILINKIQTEEDYSKELEFIRSVDSDYIERRYSEYERRLKEALQTKNVVASEIYAENIKALSKVLKRDRDENRISEDIKGIKKDREKEELYRLFYEATMNQEMVRANNIFKRLKEKGYVKGGEKAKRLEEILNSLSDAEEGFYKTASKQDSLLIEIEREKRNNNIARVKELERDLSSVKSDMVFKKRALDRAAKRLETVRELFEEVKLE